MGNSIAEALVRNRLKKKLLKESSVSSGMSYKKKVEDILKHQLGSYETGISVEDIRVVSETPGTITLKVDYEVDVQIPMVDPEDRRTYYEQETDYRSRTMTFDFDELDEAGRIVPGRDERGNRVNWVDDDAVISDEERRNADPNPGRDPDYEEPVKLKYISDTWNMIDKYGIEDWEDHDSYISMSKASYEKMLTGAKNKRYIMNLKMDEDTGLTGRQSSRGIKKYNIVGERDYEGSHSFEVEGPGLSDASTVNHLRKLLPNVNIEMSGYSDQILVHMDKSKRSRLQGLLDKLNGSLDEDLTIDDDPEETEQKYSSAATSINSSKLPALFKMVKFEKDSINLDYGGGRFDNVAEYLMKEYGATNLVYDKYNRTADHNKEVLSKIRQNGGADTVTCSNVLNVIAEESERLAVLRNCKRYLKSGGTCYVTVYEGNGTGEGAPSKSGYQLNRKTADYEDEIKQVFPGATRKGKLWICK